MVANKEDIENMKKQQEAIDKIQDPKEKEVEQKNLMTSQTRYLGNICENAQTNEKVQTLSDEQKKLLVKAIFNVFLVGLKDKEAVDRSKSLVAGIQANPTVAVSFSSDLPKLKDIAMAVPVQATQAVDLGGKLMSLAKTAKVEPVMPKASSEPAQEVPFP